MEIANKNKDIAAQKAKREQEIQKKIQDDTASGIDTSSKEYNDFIEGFRKFKMADVETVESE